MTYVNDASGNESSFRKAAKPFSIWLTGMWIGRRCYGNCMLSIEGHARIH